MKREPIATTGMDQRRVKGLTFSYGQVHSFPFLIVRITVGGQEGLGEALVPPNEFMDQFLASLIGADTRSRDALIPATDTDHDRILCEAVSIALHDLVGRLSGLPLCALLGGTQESRVPLMPCIFPHDPEEAGAQAAGWFSQGYRYLKTKLTGNFEEDVTRVCAIRQVDPLGRVLVWSWNHDAILRTTLNLDYVVLHTDRNLVKFPAIKQAYSPGVDIENLDMESSVLLASHHATAIALELVRKFDLDLEEEYYRRSRHLRQVNLPAERTR